jgi:hypothetical protein
MPIPVVLPKPLLSFALFEPEEEQDTSYFAASERMLNFSRILSQFIAYEDTKATPDRAFSYSLLKN